jgi:restriction endonuclease S subunit
VLDLLLYYQIKDRTKYKRHFSSLKNIKIPKAPIDIQQKIVDEIEELEKKAKTVVINDLQEQKEIILKKYL